MLHPRLLFPLLAFSATIAPSLAEPAALPDYHKDAPKVHLRKCDSKTTLITMYQTADYYVTEAITKSGNVFIVYYSKQGEVHFLMQAADSLERIELARESWYEKIEKAAPNYFRHVRRLQETDCYVAEEYR